MTLQGSVRHPHRWRDWAIPLLIVAATVTLLVGSLAVWVRRQALDTPYIVGASGQMLQDPKIRSAVAVSLVDDLYRRVDVEGQIRSLLPKQARFAAAPAAAALRIYAPQGVEEILGTSVVVSAWEASVRVADRAFLQIVNGDLGTEREVYLGLRPLLLELAARAGIERQVAPRLPADAGRLPLFGANRIGRLREGIRLLKSVSVYGVLAAAALYGVVLALARGRRREVLLRIGLAVFVTGVALLLVRSLAGVAVVDSLVGSNSTLEPAGMDVWRILSEPLASIAGMAIATGLTAMALALLAGPSHPAIGLRAALAPALVRYPAIAWSVVGLAVAVVLLKVPAFDATRLISRSVLILVLIGGTEMVRRITQAEHHDGGWVLASTRRVLHANDDGASAGSESAERASVPPRASVR